MWLARVQLGLIENGDGFGCRDVLTVFTVAKKKPQQPQNFPMKNV